MCELFALSSDKPANVTFSLGVFGERIVLSMTLPLGEVVVFKRGRRV